MATLTRRADHPYMSLRDAMDKLFADSFGSGSYTNGSSHETGSGAPVNVYEDADRFYLHLLAPGVDPEQVEITAANGVLSISGQQRPLTQEGWRPVWQEFNPAQFRRQLRLPSDIAVGEIDATYENGILLITVPKAEHLKPKSIQVKVGKPSAN